MTDDPTSETPPPLEPSLTQEPSLGLEPAQPAPAPTEVHLSPQPEEGPIPGFLTRPEEGGEPLLAPDWKQRVISWAQESKTQLSRLFARAGGYDGVRGSGTAFPKIEPTVVGEWIQRKLKNQGTPFYIKLGTVVLCTYSLSDLTGLWMERFIPTPPPPRPLVRALNGRSNLPSFEDYQIIFTRNLFNSQGIIPDEDAGPVDPGGPPIRTTLPFSLIGTLILQDEARSVATIEDKSASTVYPVRVDDEIPSKARILKVEARRVIFLNLGSGRREFVDLPEEQDSSAPKITLGAAPGGSAPAGAGVERVSSTQFNISRSEVDRTLSDLNNILTQARAVPNLKNGVPNGYKLFQIVPGSIYDKLGLKNNDTILGLDGQPINDPGKAFELLSTLKTASHLDLQIERNGRTQSFSYDFR